MIVIKTRVPGAHIILQINRYLYSVIIHKFFLANKTLKSLFFSWEKLSDYSLFQLYDFQGLYRGEMERR